MLTKKDIQRKLNQELYTIMADYDIEIDNRLYTEAEYENLKETLLRLRELNMTNGQMDQLLAVNM
ncbi:hypothetical protein [Levilactobacillus zymae]|uniref:Phage protein n=1 Tax=Levilactobacillus zymae TaxID=267363 RepID=A0A1Y6JYM6_9LACO|nr:hypothetical protein [Levilactobacillus zymae]KRL06995.1 hypothetical protein FD38_GL000375 [Levilactobacillus zymae DSM 19395]QFR62351.1 hypothetical protein LZ395_12705 [Levilactobacillus zymae]GEO73292.1 hypothetical protein LZY01_24600 [Levilactobacillus zymae]SMS15046.1 hypothetical protein LZ3411_1996 [Levilactobacillus zymae]